MTLSYKILENGVTRDATAEERAEIDALQKTEISDKERKLSYIRDIRNEKLSETDYLATSDNTMPNYIKTWRQTLRDLPQNNTTESQYDTLLERDTDGSLKNSIWTQPTS